MNQLPPATILGNLIHRSNTLFPGAAIAVICGLVASFASSQEEKKTDKSPQPEASVGASIDSSGKGRIVVEARGELPEPAVFYRTSIDSHVTTAADRIKYEAKFSVKILQGEAEKLTYWLRGTDRVTEVTGKTVSEWSVRKDGQRRLFLDVILKEKAESHEFVVRMQSGDLKLPTSHQVTHFSPFGGESAGIEQVVSLKYGTGVVGRVTAIEGFLPVEKEAGKPERYQTNAGGKFLVQISPAGTMADPVELSDCSISGQVDDTGGAGSFRLQGVARVREAGASIEILKGRAAISRVPASAIYRLKLGQVKGQPVYHLVFSEAGNFPVEIEFVAGAMEAKDGWRQMDFTVAGGAVMPMKLSGLDEKIEFSRASRTVTPIRQGNEWQSFLPANGHANFAWKTARQTGEGKLFFTTTAKIEAQVGAGLLRQRHQIDYRILQGQLEELVVDLAGAGEVLEVAGAGLTGWEVKEADDDAGTRWLEIKLSQPIVESAQIEVRTQTALDAFPVRVQGMRLTPDGAVRHSGHVRLSNLGSVRLEPAGLSGLTQLAPEQFPGDAIAARQVFVYRFPSTNYEFEVVADRVQPEVSVSELVRYELTETDRVIHADVELDVREAPIRDWTIGVPADYSVVELTGAGVTDHVVGSDVADGQRSVNVIFSEDVSGRRLISMTLEKNEIATAGDWILPRLEFPDARSIRGDIGVAAAPGFRISVGETGLLLEKPLSYFPRPVPHLQQAFRIREPGWSATMQIEPLEKSVQADVFHLYSLNQGTAYASVVLNYFVTGAPVSEWELTVPEDIANVMVDGKDVRTWRREGDTLKVSLHQPVIGPYTLLVTSEEPVSETGLQAGRIVPLGVQGESGFVQVVSPRQVKVSPSVSSEGLLELDPLELPAEFRLLSAAPSLGAWQYTERPFELALAVGWFEPGETITQVVEFSEVSTHVSPDGELVTDLLYYVKSKSRSVLSLRLPPEVRLWAVSVAGQAVNARQTSEATLIPLPGAADPNAPVEVRLRLGRPAVDGDKPRIELPRVDAAVLKTEWRVRGGEGQILVPTGGNVTPPQPVRPPSGFSRLADRGLGQLFLVVLLVFAGSWMLTVPKKLWPRLAGLGLLVLASALSLWAALLASERIGRPGLLNFSLPMLTPGESVVLAVSSLPNGMAGISWWGILLGVAGLAALGYALFRSGLKNRRSIVVAGIVLASIGLLMQAGSDGWFFGLVSVAIVVFWLIPAGRDWFRDLPKRGKKGSGKKGRRGEAPGAATASLLLAALFVSSAMGQENNPAPAGFSVAESIRQEWELRQGEDRLNAAATIRFSGKGGESFILLKSPAVLTQFEGEGLTLAKRNVPEAGGLVYVVSIPESDDPFLGERQFEASFEFQMPAGDLAKGIALATGPAAVQELQVRYDQTGWEFASPAAMKVEYGKTPGQSSAMLLLAPGADSRITLKPRMREVETEETRFYVETANLYVPGPGVIDGRHKIQVRPSQGQVSEIAVRIPEGLTVSDVSGPVAAWQFDAESGGLTMSLQPAQSQPFSIQINTQRGLEPLPVDATLAPLTVEGASGEVGLIALAFGPDAQPEKVESEEMSAVNLGDFDASLLPGEGTVLHRVFRFGAEGGTLNLRVAPVAPEVRVNSRQVLSFGDERVVLGINFSAEITRAGLFQLSFPLPEGFEVESLTGSSLHHWSELSEDGQRQIVLHLNGKTIGAQDFSLTLTGVAPPDEGDWEVPRFTLNEAARQTGDLVVRPTTGIRLRTVDRQNLSEMDPRQLGGEGQGALAYRLLQGDWSLTLGIEKLEPWITGEVLHQVTLREGQTRSAIVGKFTVQNASIRSLPVRLPVSDPDEIKTLRVSGKSVSDLVRTAPDSDLWDIQFKRRVVGEVEIHLDYERRGEREGQAEPVRRADFPEVRQLSYHVGVRASGRLELEAPDPLPSGWQRAEWNAVSSDLRELGGIRGAPTLTLRAMSNETALAIAVRRHSLAEALKLRVLGGTLTTVLSPQGNELTAVDLKMQVVQRSGLTVGLPPGGELFNIFVNGESVHSIRQGDDWQFYVLPGSDERTAMVRFVYAVSREKLSPISLVSPQLSVPLENISWRVVAPPGFELEDDDGDLKRVSEEIWQSFDRKSYLAKAQGKRQQQAQLAAQLLDRANALLQSGDQTRARWALSSVANQYALDAASNEDARVQLENLQTQQAIVGLNTRRQRLVLDHAAVNEAMAGENNQFKEGAASNPVLQEGETNFRPQELVQLLQGNTNEDNAVLQRIAGRLVRQQRTTESAPQAMTITLPEEGRVYSFQRDVQVTENVPLSLRLNFSALSRTAGSSVVLTLVLLVALATALVLLRSRRAESV